MDLKNQKRLAAQLLKIGKTRVRLDPARLEDIKEALTKADIRALINDEAIYVAPITGVSRGRARKVAAQKRKGRGKGSGSRKGKKGTRMPRKELWVKRIRVQRRFIKMLKGKKLLDNQGYRQLYKMSKSGLFRSKRHIKLYIDEQKMIRKRK